MPDTNSSGSGGTTRQRVSPCAIETNGVGRQSDYHLNLTVCVSLEPPRISNPLGGRRVPRARMGRPRGPVEAIKIPYAGVER
jgi:hypothetical protein